jgi:hypothetical protein
VPSAALPNAAAFEFGAVLPMPKFRPKIVTVAPGVRGSTTGRTAVTTAASNENVKSAAIGTCAELAPPPTAGNSTATQFDGPA